MYKRFNHILIITFIFIVGCNVSNDDGGDDITDPFSNQKAEDIDVIKFRGRIDNIDTESFDLNVISPSEYYFDLQKPDEAYHLLIVDKSSMHIIARIDNSQAISLKEGSYNLVVINRDDDLEKSEVVFEVIKR